MQALLAGFTLGFSLILAIGAQNAFVLRQGLARRHVGAVVATCAVSDAVLIVAGVSGMGALGQAWPWFAPAMRLGGAAFLLWYGGRAILSAWRGGASMGAAQSEQSLRAALLTCLALTWLNPHVYLDTVVLLGAVATQYDNRVAFGAGAVAASGVFFTALGYGARAIAPVFARPSAWRALDAVVGLTMWAIAAALLAGT